MKRTTVFLYEATECDLKALARQQGRPVADMVREAITEYVAREKTKTRPALRFLAFGRSGHSDTAERHEELLFAEAESRAAEPGAPRKKAASPRKPAKPSAATGKQRR